MLKNAFNKVKTTVSIQLPIDGPTDDQGNPSYATAVTGIKAFILDDAEFIISLFGVADAGDTIFLIKTDLAIVKNTKVTFGTEEYLVDRRKVFRDSYGTIQAYGVLF